MAPNGTRGGSPLPLRTVAKAVGAASAFLKAAPLCLAAPSTAAPSDRGVQLTHAAGPTHLQVQLRRSKSAAGEMAFLQFIQTNWDIIEDWLNKLFPYYASKNLRIKLWPLGLTNFLAQMVIFFVYGSYVLQDGSYLFFQPIRGIISPYAVSSSDVSASAGNADRPYCSGYDFHFDTKFVYEQPSCQHKNRELSTPDPRASPGALMGFASFQLPRLSPDLCSLRLPCQKQCTCSTRNARTTSL